MADPEGVLFVTVKQAKNLKGDHKESKTDPYVSIKCSFNRQSFKTSVLKGTYQPKWEEKFSFYTLRCTGNLQLKVYDKRGLRTHSLGSCTVDLKPYSLGEGPEEKWFPLESGGKKIKEVGSIQLRIKYFPVKIADVSSEGETSGMKVKQKKRLQDVYDVGKEIGKGGFAVVLAATHKLSGEKVAVKVVSKARAKMKEKEYMLEREIDIMRKLKHPNIVEMLDVYDDDENLYIVMEIIKGGELFDDLVKRGFYSEKDAAGFIKQILEAVSYMHKNGIAHRDLKPENLLLQGKTLKVSDFGLSKRFDLASLKTACGTPDYAAPEVILGKGSYDSAVDIWSAGVICYILLCGYPPFYAKTTQELFRKIIAGTFKFPPQDWDDISDEAKEFIKSMLIVDPQKRPSAIDCLNNPWIRGKCSTESLRRLDSFKVQISNYQQRRKLTPRKLTRGKAVSKSPRNDTQDED